MYIINDFLFSLNPQDISLVYDQDEKSENPFVNPSLQEYLSKIKKISHVIRTSLNVIQ